MNYFFKCVQHLNSTTNKLIFTLSLFFFILGTGQAQNYYHGPDGIVQLPTSTQEIIIKFADDVSKSEMQTFVNDIQELEGFDLESLLPRPEVYMAKVKDDVSKEEIESLLQTLRTKQEIEYSNSFLVHSDGTLHGITDLLLVRLKSDKDYPQLKQLVANFDATIENRNEFDHMLYHVRTQKSSAGNALELANLLAETEIFDYAEPDFLRIMEKFSTNDPFVDDQWSLENTGSNTSQWGGTAGADMSVFDAWNTSTGSSSIKVAIIDEGVDLSHPDLAANMLGGYDATGQGSGGGPSGDDAHGTACAGIVAAVGNNNIGIAGVAYDSKIIPVRIAYSNAQGNWVTSNSWIGNALNWSWQTAGADVLSNSWGGGSSSSTINNAIDGAVNNGRGGLGAPVLFAAGNSNGNNSYPATYTPTISVIAMSMCNQRKSPSSCDGETWWGSNYGNGADVAAPGVKIYATDISGGDGYSTGDYVSNFNGTSSACPNAAGVMALILSVDGSLTETEARAVLESNCDKVGGYSYTTTGGQPNGTWSNDLGYGRVNADAALASLGSGANDDAGISAIISPNGVVCSTSTSPVVELRNFGANTLNSVTIYSQLDGGSISSYSWSGSLASGGSTNVTLPSVGFSSGSHSFLAYTSNPNGNADTNGGNDSSSSSFDSADNPITLSITLDDYPEETSWEILSGGTVVASGGTYGNEPDGSTITVPLCAGDGCYDFVIYDSYGDGICCAYGNGSYSLTDDSNGTTLASGGSFGSSETTNFCVGSTGSPLVASASGIDVSCAGGSDGSASASASGGASPYSYSWSNGSSSANISGLSAGTYTVVVTDSNGDTDNASVSIGQPSAMNLSMSSTDDDGSGNGTATVSVSGGSGSYSYSWSNGGFTATISNLTAGTYSVIVTDANGCQVTDSVDVILDSGSCTYVGVNFNDFESGWGIWNDGGSDARRSSRDANFALDTYCVRLRDNTGTSVMTTDDIDLSTFNELTVDFSYYARSMDNATEDFWLQVSTNGGSSYTTVEEWNQGDEFVNNQRYYDAVVIPGPFSSNTRLRFRCDASGNSDWIYIDEVDVTGCTTSSNYEAPPVDFSEELIATDIEEETEYILLHDLEEGMKLFPNPAKELININLVLEEQTTAQMVITDLRGQIIYQQDIEGQRGLQKVQITTDMFNSGLYFINIQAGETLFSEKLVIMK